MDTLTGQRFTRGRIWTIAVIACLLIAGHGFILYTVSKHLALSAGVVGGVALLVVIKHLGFLGPVYAFLRRYWRRY
jgi:hypothetical protein